MSTQAKFPNSVPAHGRKPIARRRGIFHAQSGQSLIEVALLVPLLTALFFGAVEVGRFAYISILVGNAARAGAAYGSQSLLDAIDTTGIAAAADNDFQNNGQNASTITVSSSTSCGCDNAGTIIPSLSCTTTGSSTAGICTSGQWVVLVSVTVSGTFQPIFHYPWIPSSITITRTVTMRVDQAG